MGRQGMDLTWSICTKGLREHLPASAGMRTLRTGVLWPGKGRVPCTNSKHQGPSVHRARQAREMEAEAGGVGETEGDGLEVCAAFGVKAKG